MVLLLHQGPICKFESDLCCWDPTEFPFDRWILILSRNNIAEITICMAYKWVRWKMPSSFFTIENLKQVCLQYCILKIPHNFCGLKLLQSLKLTCCIINDDDFEKLVLSCPLLEDLYFHSSNDIAVKINSSKLKFLDLSFYGHRLKYVQLITPVLIEAKLSSMQLSTGEHSYRNCLIDVFGSLSKIETLHVGNYFIRYLILGLNLEVPLRFNYLKELSIEVDIQDRKEVTVFFSLLQNAPNLEHLSLYIHSPKMGSDASSPIGTFWNLSLQKIKFEHLKFVFIAFLELEWESAHVLIRLFFRAAPSLEKVDARAGNKHSILSSKLVSFNGASKEAEILLFDSTALCLLLKWYKISVDIWALFKPKPYLYDLNAACMFSFYIVVLFCTFCQVVIST